MREPEFDDSGAVGPENCDTAEPPIHRFGTLATSSPAMKNVLDLLGRLSQTDLTITLVGETGTGKDVLANAIHALSRRSECPFVVFDCGAVPTNLAESELFGHERGSFTGALAAHAGAFERAHGGTLFLDEVGELPLDLQPRLLRVLESRRVRRVGGSQDRAVDVRIVAATNRDLEADVAAGKFRQDLYFRLAEAVVPVPPLRERPEDVALLVPRLLGDLGRGDVRVTAAALRELTSRDFPGNVRELKNTLACAAAFLETDEALEPKHLSSIPPPFAGEAMELEALGGASLDRLERTAIEQTLALTGGNKSQAAKKLGIAVSTLYEKIKKYGL
jgi:DNA-binding NtrC family response regulator